MLVHQAFAIATGAAAPSGGTVTLGAITSYGAFNTTTWTGNHTLDALDDLVLVLAMWRAAGDTDHACTYGGVAATKINRRAQGNLRVQASWIANASLPSPGSISWSSSIGSLTRGFLVIAALRGAVQTTPAENGVSAASGTSVGPTSVTAASGGIGFQALSLDPDEAVTQGQGTEILDGSEPLSGDRFFASRAASVGATVSLSSSWTTSGAHCQMVIGVSPA